MLDKKQKDNERKKTENEAEQNPSFEGRGRGSARREARRWVSICIPSLELCSEQQRQLRRVYFADSGRWWRWWCRSESAFEGAQPRPSPFSKSKTGRPKNRNITQKLGKLGKRRRRRGYSLELFRCSLAALFFFFFSHSSPQASLSPILAWGAATPFTPSPSSL